MTDLKTEKIYMRINADLKAAITDIAKAENRSLSNLIETLIVEKVNSCCNTNNSDSTLLNEDVVQYNPTAQKSVVWFKPRKYNNYSEDKVQDEGDGKKLRHLLQQKRMTLVDFRNLFQLKEYDFKKLFYGNGKVDEELAKKIEKILRVDKSYWK